MQLLALSLGLDASSNDDTSKRDSHKRMLKHEPLRAQCSNVCLSLRSCVCRLPTIMRFKHSYMHNHASYMLVHLIKLLYYPYTLHFQFYVNLCQNFYNHVNFKFLQSCQFQISTIMSISNFYNHVNFKLLQLCQFLTSTIMSIYSHVNFKLLQSCQVNFNLYPQCSLL